MGGKKKSAKAKAKKRESLAPAVTQDVSAVAEPVPDEAVEATEVATSPVADAAPAATPVDIPLVTAAPEVLKANLANLVASSLPKVEHFTVDERVSIGKAVRAQAPLESHAEWTPSPYRVDPVTLLEEQAETRVAELVPIRYGRMMVSPFAFYRGAAYVMAADLASTPSSGLRVQACGDAHLMNFGVFASPERTLMFDMNDFDETLPGPWEWDVKRLAVSFEVAARARGFADKDRRSLVLGVVRSYRETMRAFAEMKNLEVWYAKLDLDTILQQLREQKDTATVAKNTERALAKIRSKDNARAFEKLTVATEGEPRIVADPPLLVPIADLVTVVSREEFMSSVKAILRGYRRTLQRDRGRLLESYRVVDVARKVVGVGSVGTRTNVVLLLGRDDQDPLFLQVKEARDSVLAPFVGRSLIKNQGQRVVEGQRMMQATSDIFLGWIRFAGVDGIEHDHYVRQLWDAKGSVDPAVMLPKGFEVYARICGWTLARAHARSGDRIAIASYLGKTDVFDNAIAEFSAAYADQNERDHQALVEAVKSGRIAATQGV
jgi:uncharacterized protein (DUF2252 family)